MEILILPQSIHLISFGHILRKGIAGLYRSSILTSWGTSILFSIMAIAFTFLVTRINFSPCLCLSSVQFNCSVVSDPLRPMDCSTPDLPVHHQLLELTQTHVHCVSDVIQPSHPLSSPSPPALNLSQHQGLFQWVSSSHEVAKVLELHLQHQSFQWIFRTDLL